MADKIKGSRKGSFPGVLIGNNCITIYIVMSIVCFLNCEIA